MDSFSRAHKIPHMHVHWLSYFSYADPRLVYQSALASLRLRAGPLVSVADSHLTVSIGEKIPLHADVCVVGKIGAHDIEQRKTEWIKAIFKLDCPVVLDYTDDHIQHPSVMTDFYQVALERADQVVCSSQDLHQSISTTFLKTVSVIEDAVEYLPVAPKSTARMPRRLLWFGHHSNLNALFHFLQTFNPPMPIEVLVLSTEQGRQMLQPGVLPPSSSVRLLFKHWSIDEMPKAAMQCDACIIPVDDSSPAKKGASSNRLLTSLTLGLPTCVDLIPSYLPFRDFVTDLHSPQLVQLIKDPQAHHSQIELAQRHIGLNYSFQSLGRKWKNTFT